MAVGTVRPDIDLNSHLTVVSIQPAAALLSLLCYLDYSEVVVSLVVTGLLSRLYKVVISLVIDHKMLSPVCYLDYSKVVISFVIDHTSVIFSRPQEVITSLVIDNKSVIFGLLSRLHLSCDPIDHLTMVTGS